MLTRRELGGLGAALSLAATAGCAPAQALALGTAGGFSVDDLERRTFQWFWDTANPANGLVPDRWPTKSFCSIAAVGFALNAYAIGVERGWITRRRGARPHADHPALLRHRAAGAGGSRA